MAQAQVQDTVVTKIGIGLHTDSDPIDQPKGTHRFALNAVDEATDGQIKNLSNERSNINVEALTEGFYPIGDRYIGDDLSVVISINPTTGAEEIGTLTKDDVYTVLVETKVLGLKLTNQCDLRYRLRRGNQRIVYWVDGLNVARSFNLDKIYNYYNSAFKAYLKGGGNPLTYVGEKYEASAFDLIKSYSLIPFFADVKIVETGNALPGSYNFAVQYVDEDLNPTEWITTSNIVRLYNDTITNPYEKIRGSRNIASAAQTFERTNKSIRLTISNLDQDFPYYRVAIIRAAGNNGLPEKVYASDLYSTSDSNFIYTGNDSQLAEISLADILIDKEVIYAPKHIEQIENRLTLHNGKGKSVNWCDFQKYASKISSNLTTKQVLLNNILSDPNEKGAKSTFLFRGYMPGEVYSFGVVYIFKDGYLSPVFHIPGKGTANATSLMKVYEGDSRYLDIHNCSTDNYWGKDMDGNTLVGKKQRPHRFPFRKDVNKPLYVRSTTANNINKHRLKLTITLAPGKTYPVDGGGAPIPIDYTINYQVTGAPTGSDISNIFTDSDLGSTIIIYDDTEPLDDISGTDKGELEPTCDMFVNYMPVGNETFILTFTYETYVASSTVNDDVSDIFGIEFSNIEKPHPDVVGFYIVRNERTDDDKLIIDNAVFGPMTSYNQYKSFGLITPKQYFAANNCGRVGNSGKTLTYFDKGLWFFNPEFQFFNKKTDFDHVEVEGLYSEASVDYPTISNTTGSACNGPFSTSDKYGSKGVYVDDVQAGTSYNPDINKKKNKDDDGFDLIVGYKNTNFTYAINNVLVIPTKKVVLYLNAASYQNLDGKTYYNVSVDNKIGQFISDNAMAGATQTALHNTGTNANGLIYGSLVRDNTNAYGNFMTRSYYKEHNNPFYFGNSNVINGVKVFNGDAEISALHMVSSVFYDIVVADRAKKSKVWKIIVGSLLIIASVAAAILTAGASIPLSAAGISYGVSLLSSGIKFEQMKAMFDEDYEKGLKETVTDGGVYATIRDTLGRADDTIRWFSDRASNVYIESSVPFGLRSGLTSGTPDFIDAPCPYNEDVFRTYLTEKYTILDRDQGSGRLYKGYASAEFYDMNKDYMRFNKEKLFRHLSSEYDCCVDKNEVFPTRSWYSEQSFQEEKVDNYGIFLPNNYRDMEGEHGEITNVYRLGNNLFIETKEALWQLPQNNQERVTGEIVSFIGTGSFFDVPPKKVMDDPLGSGGTQHKWATIKTNFGSISINESQHKIYLHAGGIKDLTEGNEAMFRQILKPFLNEQLFKKFNTEHLNSNNPANPDGIGYHSTFDKQFSRVLITKKDYSILQEKLDLLSLVPTKPLIGNNFVYAMDDGKFYQGQTQIKFDNISYFQNRSWTISYSFNRRAFIGFHSYLPNYYIRKNNALYSFVDNAVWKHHREGHVQTFYGKYNPFIIEYVSINNPLIDRTLEDIVLQTYARKWNPANGQYIEDNLTTFNKITCYNRLQSTGELIMRAKEAQANPDQWYAQQTVNTPGIIIIERQEKNWNVNDLRDYVIDYDESLFTTDWNILKFLYPIDKVVNPNAISFAKDWQDLQSLRDKYVIIRLKFDNFNDVNLTFNYGIDSEPLSTK